MTEPASINTFAQELINRGVDVEEVYALLGSLLPTALSAEAFVGDETFPILPVPIAFLQAGDEQTIDPALGALGTFLTNPGIDREEVFALLSSVIPTAPPTEAWTGAEELPVLPLPIALLQAEDGPLFAPLLGTLGLFLTSAEIDVGEVTALLGSLVPTAPPSTALTGAEDFPVLPVAIQQPEVGTPSAASSLAEFVQQFKASLSVNETSLKSAFLSFTSVVSSSGDLLDVLISLMVAIKADPSTGVLPADVDAIIASLNRVKFNS